MDLVFNELSLQPPFDGVSEAKKAMNEIVDTLSAALRGRRIQSLRTDGKFVARSLCDGYTVGHWLIDKTVDREAKRLVASATTRAPFVESLIEDAEGARLAEFTCNGTQALGIALAVLRDEATLSANRAHWNVDPIVVRALYVSANGVQETDEAVCNVFSTASLIQRAAWFDERALISTRTGVDVLADSYGLFVRLQFTEVAERQLRALRGTEPHFALVVAHLAALNRQAERWREGVFTEGYPFRCSPDSQPTLEQFGDQRTFDCPDGTRRMFSWHSKVGIGAQRIYFQADKPSSSVLIGYVGPHLQTVSE